ncbi:uncharacterized protein Tco025E_02408, partial [Trypanosoma conorhini]
GRTCQVGRSSREGGAPYGSGPSAPGPCAVSIRRFSKPGAPPEPGPGEKGGPGGGRAEWPRERARGTRRASWRLPRHMRGAGPAALSVPLGKKRNSPPCRRRKLEKDAEEHLHPHALVRSLAIPATPSGSICPRRTAQVTPRGLFGRVQRQRPHKKRPCDDREAGAADRCQRFLGAMCAQSARAAPQPLATERTPQAPTLADLTARANRAVVRKQLVCEGAPGHLLPRAARQSKFDLEGLEAPELDSSACNWLGSLAGLFGPPSREPFAVHGDNTCVDGVARPLGGGSALCFIVLLLFPALILLLRPYTPRWQRHSTPRKPQIVGFPPSSRLGGGNGPGKRAGAQLRQPRGTAKAPSRQSTQRSGGGAPRARRGGAVAGGEKETSHRRSGRMVLCALRLKRRVLPIRNTLVGGIGGGSSFFPLFRRRRREAAIFFPTASYGGLRHYLGRFSFCENKCLKGRARAKKKTKRKGERLWFASLFLLPLRRAFLLRWRCGGKEGGREKKKAEAAAGHWAGAELPQSSWQRRAPPTTTTTKK